MHWHNLNITPKPGKIFTIFLSRTFHWSDEAEINHTHLKALLNDFKEYCEKLINFYVRMKFFIAHSVQYQVWDELWKFLDLKKIKYLCLVPEIKLSAFSAVVLRWKIGRGRGGYSVVGERVWRKIYLFLLANPDYFKKP